MAIVFLADLAPGRLLLLGPVLIALGVLYVRTAYWWYNWVTPSWRDSDWKRLFAAVNRWGTAGLFVFIGLSALGMGIARLG